MARNKAGGWRVLGPYRERHRQRERWRIVIVEPTGERESCFFATEIEAEAGAKQAWVEIAGASSFEQAIDRYREHLQDKGNRPASINSTRIRLRGWLPLKEPVFAFTRQDAERCYAARRAKVKPATHRAELAEVKTFFRWLVNNKLIRESPVEQVTPVGRVSRGKPQLHVAEAISFSEVALDLCRRKRRGWEAALGNLLCLFLGLRSGEVCHLRVRDVDRHPGGVDLWIAEEGGKTDAARRRVPVEGELVELLLEQVKGKEAEGWLFPAKTGSGHRTATWLRQSAHRLCELAEVPYSPPHGLRGTQGSLSVEAGATSQLVAQQLGHSNTRVTEEHYIRKDATTARQVRSGLRLMAGGR